MNRVWRLIRYNIKETYTEGVLYDMTDNVKLCDTLEDRIIDADKSGNFEGEENKVYGQSAIPYGTYKLIVTYSPKFKRKMVLVENVPHFTGIRLHWGRTAKNSEGCILVGKKTKDGELSNIQMTDILTQLVEKEGEIKLEIV